MLNGSSHLSMCGYGTVSQVTSVETNAHASQEESVEFSLSSSYQHDMSNENTSCHSAKVMSDADADADDKDGCRTGTSRYTNTNHILSNRGGGVMSAMALTSVVAAVLVIFSVSSSSSHRSESNRSAAHEPIGKDLKASANFLGSWLNNFDGVLDPGSGEATSPNWQANKSKEPSIVACEYIAHPAFGKGVSELVGTQTSRKDPRNHWSDFGCLRRSGKDGDIVVPGSDAANIVIDIPFSMISDGTKGSRSKPMHQFQTILGFGGSITEATTLNWKSLSSVARDRVLELLYGDSGLGYVLGRVPMGSSDFSVSPYNFAEAEDLSLGSFDKSVQRDYDNGMIDMIKSARYVTQHSWEEATELNLLSSPWSPPPWMKQALPSDPFDASHARTMVQTALPECLREGTGADSKYARAWAQYFSEYLSAYSRRGVEFWAVTVQNAPLSESSFEACGHSKATEKEFVNNHLGPVLRDEHPHVKILAYDNNKDQCVDFMQHFWDPNITLNDEISFVDGAALHWYSRSSRALDGGEGTPNMHRLKEMASKRSDKTKTRGEEPLLIDTEASHCKSTGYAIGDPHTAWQRAERTAHAILSQLAAGSNGFIESNMLLDPFGGPNHAENFCDAPLIAVPHRADSNANFLPPVPYFEKHQLQDGESIKGEYETKYALHKIMGYPMDMLDIGIVVQPMYYYAGHISRYVRPGSRPLRAIVDDSAGGSGSRAFRPTGHVGAGGGYNNLAQEGTEVTFWPCEGSTRQSWSFNKGGEIQMVQYNRKKNSMECVSLADTADIDLGGLLLTQCGSTISGHFDIISVAAAKKNVVRFSSKKSRDMCLGIQKLANQGGSYGPRGGSQAAMFPCTHESTMWTFDSETGELLSSFYKEGDVCMTTGWPFLQAGVFDTSSATSSSKEGSGIAMVVLNESGDDAAFVVRVRNKKSTPLLKASIPAHSIQTFS